jgi:hypothetical protein
MGGHTIEYGSSGSYDWRRDVSITRVTSVDYSIKDKREYTGNESKGIPAPKGKEISTDSKLAEILVVDVTGSMGKWPGLIFQRIPTLYSEANVAMQGLSLDDLAAGKIKPEDVLELCVIAIGDAKHDRQPLQVVDFSKGGELVKGINDIYPEAGGGPFGCESYELVAHYLDRHCKTPNAAGKPVLIWACDEDFYEKIEPSQVEALIGDKIGQPLDSSEVMAKLKDRFDMYVLRPEPEGQCAQYARAQKHWENILGAQRVFRMQKPERLVDCIIQVSAMASGNYDLGKDLLERRQTPEQVKDVLDSIVKPKEE